MTRETGQSETMLNVFWISESECMESQERGPLGKVVSWRSIALVVSMTVPNVSQARGNSHEMRLATSGCSRSGSRTTGIPEVKSQLCGVQSAGVRQAQHGATIPVRPASSFN